MKRLITDQLKEWKDKQNRKPLIIQGARQVGKTWVMKSFGARYFKKFAYINFESNSKLQSVFEADLEIPRLISVFEIETGMRIDEETLIILDEIQEAKGGLTALKYFCENAPQYYLMAAGSFLGVSLQKGHTFPVGKVDFLRLYPLSFEEFLLNNDEEMLLEKLKAQEWQILIPFHEKLISLLRLYYYVGGMPEVVQEYITSKNLRQVRELQNNILLGYENDFSKHAPIATVPKIRMVWHSIIGQLAKENKKFVYGQLRKGARAKEFESAINWLVNSGLVHKSHRITKPGIPLLTYAEIDAFKLYLLDIGLLNAMAGLSEKTLLDKNQILVGHKGAMTEQFVAQELVIRHGLFYWSAENGTSELDFILQKDDLLIPVEAKAEENLKAKSLKVFAEKYKPAQAVRTSMSYYRPDGWLVNIPLYAVFTI